jgi:hypothetical protein
VPHWTRGCWVEGVVSACSRAQHAVRARSRCTDAGMFAAPHVSVRALVSMLILVSTNSHAQPCEFRAQGPLVLLHVILRSCCVAHRSCLQELRVSWTRSGSAMSSLHENCELRT